MKRVVIVRHAKAEQYGYDNDLDRHLTERGEDDAELVSKELKRLKVFPDLIISSPARRTTKTAEIFASNLNYPKKSIWFEKKLYHGKSPENFLEMLKELEEEVSTVFVFGHNPSVYYYMNYLMRDFTDDVPTCSTVAIDFDVSLWRDLRARTGEMGLRIIPDMLKE
jgi:phosphohistidine phosphatase